MAPDEWEYSPSKTIDQGLIERLRHFPREPDITVYLLRSIAARAIRLWLKIYHRVSTRGQENLPKNGSYVLVANHSSHLDALCLTSLMPLRSLHRVFPVAALDYFFTTAPRTLLSAIVINALPFGRYSNTRHSLKLCQELLSNPGNILIIFPEGTRSADGNLGQFRPGVGLLLAGTKIPAVPCYIDGAYNAYPKGSVFPRPKKIRMVIGLPQTFEHMSEGKQSAEKIGLMMRNAIAELKRSLQSNANQ